MSRLSKGDFTIRFWRYNINPTQRGAADPFNPPLNSLNLLMVFKCFTISTVFYESLLTHFLNAVVYYYS